MIYNSNNKTIFFSLFEHYAILCVGDVLFLYFLFYRRMMGASKYLAAVMDFTTESYEIWLKSQFSMQIFWEIISSTRQTHARGFKDPLEQKPIRYEYKAGYHQFKLLSQPQRCFLLQIIPKYILQSPNTNVVNLKVRIFVVAVPGWLPLPATGPEVQGTVWWIVAPRKIFVDSYYYEKNHLKNRFLN